MQKKTFGFAKIVFASLFSFAAYANAADTVINFEDIYPGVETTDLLPANYGGFFWSGSARFVTSQLVPGTGFANGTIGDVSLFNDAGNDLSMSRGVAFNFLGAYVTAAWNNNEQVTVSGSRNGVQTYSTVIETSTDSPVYFNFNFRNIDTLVFHAQGGVNAELGGEGDHIVIDNLRYSPVPPPAVPEPSSWAMMALGMGALALAKKRAGKRKA